MWTTPKTDWVAAVDRFNFSDYNRIKNNIVEVGILVNMLFGTVSTFAETHSDIKSYDHVWDVTEFNGLEKDLTALYRKTGYYFTDFGVEKLFDYNKAFIQANELNRIERITLKLYNTLSAQDTGRKTLAFTLNGGDF